MGAFKGPIKFAAAAVFVVGMTAGGIKGCVQENEPDETDTEQFVKGFFSAPIDFAVWAVEGVAENLSPDDVEDVLNGTEEIGRKLLEGGEQYLEDKDLPGSGRGSSDSGLYEDPVEPLPDYVPPPLPGGPLEEEDKGPSGPD